MLLRAMIAWQPAGTFSGLMQTAITTPTELLKIRLQLQTQLPGNPGYVGPLRLLKQVTMREGISGLPCHFGPSGQTQIHIAVNLEVSG